ncbi:hypothetical protein ACH5A7_03880 [Streptomyces sp. NPDC018955]|uniref:hypothetical protein n=1 Tax=Streptomyces sp. NPDC018955 TaxID=3365055 RepID=UPI0037988A84
MTAPIPMCRACRQPIEEPDNALHLGHEEVDSGPGWNIHAHCAHNDRTGPDSVAAVTGPVPTVVPARPPS